MDFNFTEEQQLLQDTVRRFIDKDYGFEARKKVIATPLGWSRNIWKQFAELGLLGIPFSEVHGGLGASGVDTMIVMDAFGRGLVVEPYLATVVLAGTAIAHGASQSLQEALIPAIIAGDLVAAFAHTEKQARYELANVETRARRDGGGYVIDGAKSVVLHGDAADKLVVSARTAGSARDPKGITLFLVDAKAPGVTLRGYPTIDGLRGAELTLKGVRAEAATVVGEVDNGLSLVELVSDRGIAALCAEAVGAMDALNKATLEYLKTRQQFGVPIGRFQVLQHRMAEMLIHFEQAKSMAYLAAVKADSNDAAERRHALSAAKVQIGVSGRYVGQQAIQLHGGMGMTNELNVSHYFKRITLIDRTLGDVDNHLARLGDHILAESAQPAPAALKVSHG
jgi:pimeloyl-CoA dehydrogenase small subunit